MKIGIIESAFRTQWGDGRFRKIRNCGFDAIDYDLMHTHVFLYNGDEQRRNTFLQEEEKARIDEVGLEVSQVHGPCRWPYDDTSPQDRAERFEKMPYLYKWRRLLAVNAG